MAWGRTSPWQVNAPFPRPLAFTIHSMAWDLPYSPCDGPPNGLNFSGRCGMRAPATCCILQAGRGQQLLRSGNAAGVQQRLVGDPGAARSRKGVWVGQRVDRRRSYASVGPGWKIQEVSRVGT